jgi:VanZ family protein
MSPQAGDLLRPGWQLHVLPAALYLVVAFVTGSLPSSAMGPVDLQTKDKLLHFLGFWLMQWTHARALRFMHPGWSEAQVLFASFGTATVAGGLLEAWQFLLPHRTADWRDWLADGVGALLGAALGLFGRRAVVS